MATCDECDRHENLPYQCRRCGNTFCTEHRLPENHDCPGLNEWDEPAAVFDSGFDDSVNNPGGRSSSILQRVSAPLSGISRRLRGTGGPLSYFRGNLSYTFLGIMWITFALQFLVFPLVGAGFRSEIWQGAFVLSPGNIEFVWTWVTSIFAHGGFTHIAFNSIALYFFGPVVERYLDSRRFTALFIGGGIIAGLAQVMSTLLTTGPTGAGVLGASGAIMAVMGVLTVLNPNLTVRLYAIIPMPLWVLTFGFAGFSIVAGFGVSAGSGLAGGNVAHLAHLAGLVIGLAYGAHVKDRVGIPNQLQLGGGGGGGMGGPGRRF
ncbi:MAG: rhomboid family protein [Haloquadratum sp. J07HQX50]|nr:MAG: rhomboid family protein [Haloquadratum sp. J07HQX50]